MAYTRAGLRELPSNVGAAPYDAKERLGVFDRRSSGTGPAVGRSPSATAQLASRPASQAYSPQVDHRQRHNPAACPEMAQDIVSMFLRRERTMARDANYMATQTEVNEKMRTILVDWLVDVHLKFKLHAETFFLTVDMIDRYLSVARVARSQLQLVGVTAILLAAKYEEIWPPELKDCIHISANTYTRDDILAMERRICAALAFKLTVPTPFPFLARLLEVVDADAATRHAAFYFLEHAVLDYKHLRFLPSQLANASLFLANVMLRKPDAWPYTLQHYSRSTPAEFAECARNLLDFTTLIASSKYQAVRRKYSSSRCAEVARLALPATADLPL